MGALKEYFRFFKNKAKLVLKKSLQTWSFFVREIFVPKIATTKKSLLGGTTPFERFIFSKTFFCDALKVSFPPLWKLKTSNIIQVLEEEKIISWKSLTWFFFFSYKIFYLRKIFFFLTEHII